MKKRQILGQSVPRRRLGLIYASLGALSFALVASCGATESGDSSSDGGGGEAGRRSSDDRPGEQPRPSAGRPPVEEGQGGNSGTGSIDHPGASGNMAGGAGPPVYDCAPSDVLRAPSTAIGLDSDIRDVQLASDAAGDTYFGGAVYGDYPVRVLGEQLAGPGYLVVSKLDAAGKKLWSKRFGSDQADQSDALVALAVAPSGELWVGANLSLNGRQPDEPDVSGDHRLMLARLAADGRELMRVSYAAPFDANFQGAAPAGDEAYVWGNMRTPFELDQLALEGGTQGAAFIARVDAAGRAVDVVEFSDEWIGALTVSPTGQVYALVHSFDAKSPSQILALDENLTQSWEVPFESSFTPDDKTYELNEYTGGTTLALDGDELLLASPLTVFRETETIVVLDRFKVVSGDLVSRSVLLEPSYLQEFQAFQVLPDHSLVLGGIGSSGMKVGNEVLRAASYDGPFLAQFSPQGEPLWATLFCYSSDYDYGGDLRLSYANGSLRALLATSEQLELGKPFPELSDPLLLNFDLPASPPPNNEGGQPALSPR